jgi:hypothetical protein
MQKIVDQVSPNVRDYLWSKQDANTKPVEVVGLQMVNDRTMLRYAYYKPFKHEWQKGYMPNFKRDLVWYKDGSKINKGTGARVYKWG